MIGWRGECDGREGACEMMVWCGEKEECQCVVIYSILGMLMWSVCGVSLWSGWERRVVWRKVVEEKRRNPISTL